MLEAKGKYPVLTPQNTILRVSVKDIPTEELVGGEFTITVYRVGTPYLSTFVLAPYAKQNSVLLFNIPLEAFTQGEGRYAYELRYETVLLDTRQFVYAVERLSTATEDAAPFAAPPVTATKAVALHDADPQAHATLLQTITRSILSVTFSGDYNDLTNKPVLFSGAYADLTGKPTLFSGDYNDLTNKPTIPTQYTDEQAQDAAAAALVHTFHTNITATYDDANNRIVLVGGGGGGSSYTDEQARDVVAAMFAAGTHSGISFDYDGAEGRINVTVAGGGASGIPIAAGESLAANSFVSIGPTGLVQADAANDKPAHGFVLSAYAEGAVAQVSMTGTLQASGLTPGQRYYLRTAGGMGAAMTGVGELIQSVGTAISNTELAVKIDTPMKRMA